MSGRDYLGDAVALRDTLDVWELVHLLQAQDQLRELLEALAVHDTVADVLVAAGLVVVKGQAPICEGPRCAVCGEPADPRDLVRDQGWTLCGPAHGNGCSDRYEVAR